MKEMKRDENQRKHTFTEYVGITVLAFFILVSIAGAAPFAYITNYDANAVAVIDTSTNTITSTVDVGNGPNGVAISPDGKKVYVTNWGSYSVSVIDTSTNKVTATINVESAPCGVAVTPNGEKVYVANWGSGTVCVINTSTNAVKATIKVGTYPHGVAVTPDGKKVYVANYVSKTVSIIDTTTETVTNTINGVISAWGVTITPDGKKVYVTNDDSNTVSVIDTSTNTITTIVDVGSISYGIAITPDGTKVYVANVGNNNVSVINTAKDTVTTTVPVGKGPEGIAVTPDGTKVYVANSASGTLSIIDTTTNTVIATVAVGSHPVSFGQFIGSVPVKATPTITWNNPTDITAGIVLSSTQLNAIASVPGTFVYTPSAGTMLNTGTHKLHVDFTPSDPTTYNTASSDVQINVVAAPLKTPTITWNNPADITYGAALDNTQLNAVATDPVSGATVAGTFTCTPGEGTILAVGTHKLHVDFTPADTANYNSISKEATINVLKATPTITWNNPADIRDKTALSSTQLNAVASVPGTFVYTPASGTLLNAGTQTLKVDFTPSDTANYNSVSQTVTINVLRNNGNGNNNGNNGNNGNGHNQRK